MSDEQTDKKGLPTTVHTAPEDISVKDIARLMTARGVGAVVVMDGVKPVGIVTDRDIVVRVTAPGRDPMTVLVGEVMSKPLVTVSVAASVETAIELMGWHGVRRLPIVDDSGRLSSILTLDDILRLNLTGSSANLAPIVRERPAPLAPLQQEVRIAPSATRNSDMAMSMAPAPAPTPAPSPMPSRPVASVARASVVVPMVKRRRRRTRKEAIRHWIEKNRTFVIFVVGLSLAGSLVALSADFVGRAIYTYQQTPHYEPKDDARRIYLEEQRERDKKADKSRGSSR